VAIATTACFALVILSLWYGLALFARLRRR
jgi:hypothetical protein